MRSLRRLQLPLIIGMSAFLSGCVLPERLDGDISLSGYRYAVTLEGRLAEPRTIGALAKGQALSVDHEEQLKAQEASALKLPGMVRFAYAGEGRYDFAMQIEGELTEAAPIVGFPNTQGGAGSNFLTIRREQDGSVVISSPEVPPKAVADLSEVGLGASGKISIEFTGSLLESNADDQPADGLHVWHRTKWEDRVFLKFDPNGS